MLINSLKTLHITKTDLPSCFSKGPLKPEFLDSYLTTFFGVRNFVNTSAMRVIFFLKMFKIESSFQKLRKKFRKCLKLSLLTREYLSLAVNV